MAKEIEHLLLRFMVAGKEAGVLSTTNRAFAKRLQDWAKENGVECETTVARERVSEASK